MIQNRFLRELLRMGTAASGEGDDPKSDYHAAAQEPFTPAQPPGLVLVEQPAWLHQLELQAFATARLTLPHPPSVIAPSGGLGSHFPTQAKRAFGGSGDR